MHTRLLYIGLISISLLISACNLSSSPQPIDTALSTDITTKLTLAWVENGNLLVWQTGDDIPRRIAVGGVITPFISPDGKHVAFTRGPQGAPDSLWVTDTVGIAERELVGRTGLATYQSGVHQIGQVEWMDAEILYFNTFTRDIPQFKPRDDLYRANIITRQVSLILPPTEGGRFALHRETEQIAIVYAGTYQRQDATVRVIDALGQSGASPLLFFNGVASGGHSLYYPQPHWSEDGQSVFIAIPDSDLIYQDTTADLEPTRLWRLAIDIPSDREIIGTVDASYFGLPTWSDSTQTLMYASRETATNAFTLNLASTDGTVSQGYIQGDAGTLSLGTWLPNSEQFMYALNSASTYYIGVMDEDPKQLSSEVTFLPTFINATQYIYLTPRALASDGFQFRMGILGETTSQFLTNGVQQLVPYDVVLVEHRDN